MIAQIHDAESKSIIWRKVGCEEKEVRKKNFGNIFGACESAYKYAIWLDAGMENSEA